jgi:Bacterial cadherin-like domain
MAAPVAFNDSYTTNEDTALGVAAPGILANDTDPELDQLTAALVSGPANGTVTLNALTSASIRRTETGRAGRLASSASEGVAAHKMILLGRML